MFTHSKLWGAIDQLARQNGYSASGLAKKAGLDPTSFNKSKRKSKDGKARWPSTESISKILKATDSNMASFIALMGEEVATQIIEAEPKIIEKEVIVEKEIIVEKPVKGQSGSALRTLPMLRDDVAADPEMFDESGYPLDANADRFDVPNGYQALSDYAWALEVSGTAMAPYYQEGDVIIIDPYGPARAGDPFLIRRKSEDKLAVYRGQSAHPAIGTPLGRIMGVYYCVTNNYKEDMAA